MLAFLATGALAQDALEVIPLKHRSAEQVIPMLRPLLEPGGALSGQYNQLIVRTSPGNLAQIRAALAAIDAPARRLMISVRFDRDSIAGGPRGETHSAEQVDQRIQALEGAQAIISTGQSRAYADAASGFAVVPRLAGANVTLEIFAQQEQFVRGGAIQGQRATSFVSGRLGEWLELGGTATAGARQDAGSLGYRETRRSSDRRVWVKVEEIRN